MPDTLADDYGLSKIAEAKRIAAPDLPYKPSATKAYHPAIGVIGCGGISAQHLNAYRHAGYRIAALCDRNEHKAIARRDEFFPQANVFADYRDLLAKDEIEVVDVTTNPMDRVEIIEAALLAGKHVLSQKPFVTDLAVGRRLVALAEAQHVKLAVNQNARWAPHFSYIRQAIAAGLIGDVQSANFTLHWDHRWIIGTEFEKLEHLILSDFGIHWFDLAANFFATRDWRSVSASAISAIGQQANVPMLAQAMIEFDGGLVSLFFNANVIHGQEDRTVVAGTHGTITSCGPSLSEQTVTLVTADGCAQPKLEGTWFREGFHGAMAELLCSIEEEREPANNARDNLRSLELCFAAIESSIKHERINHLL
ncbi:MAG: Gfo/Idh/MocA family oxidoreductase [Acidobacteria bacterium]|nr:Gfo/Idh/MocA family oxidoreductase [Acidobacteriota bacterium]